MANIICFKQEKGLKNCSNGQLKVAAKNKIYPDSQKNGHLENRGGVGHCPICSNNRYNTGAYFQLQFDLMLFVVWIYALTSCSLFLMYVECTFMLNH